MSVHKNTNALTYSVGEHLKPQTLLLEIVDLLDRCGAGSSSDHGIGPTLLSISLDWHEDTGWSAVVLLDDDVTYNDRSA
ncbi:MAG: hypothetical protein ACXVYY_01065 [Oryzihumus sp.]